jgi:dCMP deaminase
MNFLSFKWHYRFLKLAASEELKWSKDPSTKVVTIAVDPETKDFHVGYNGFPQKMSDDPELYANREEKYNRTIHAEMNVALKHRIKGYILYNYPFMMCSKCTIHLIQAGISEHISIYSDNPRWKDDFELSKKYLKECNIPYLLFDEEVLTMTEEDTMKPNAVFKYLKEHSPETYFMHHD